MSQQPEALAIRLARLIETYVASGSTTMQAATELRRLHAELEGVKALHIEQAEALISQRDTLAKLAASRDEVAMAWNTVRAEARALGSRRVLGELLAAVEMYGDRRVAEAALTAQAPTMPADFVPRLLAVVKIYQEQAALGIAVDAELFGAVSRLVAAQALPAAEPTRPANSQQWAGMDGATAFQLIERHADGWADIALMMSEWLAANQAAQQAAQPEFIPIAIRKLAELQDQGYLINGYSLIHKEKLARGFIDSYGFVGWWSNRDHEQAAQAPAFVPDCALCGGEGCQQPCALRAALPQPQPQSAQSKGDAA